MKGQAIADFVAELTLAQAEEGAESKPECWTLYADGSANE